MSPADPDPPRPATQAELAALFGTHADGLAGAVRAVLGPRAEVAEVLQEAYLKAARALRDGSAPRSLKAWVFVLTLNLARDHGRRRARRGPVHSLEDADAMQITSQDTGPAKTAEHAELLSLARTAIQRLREAEKRVFLMRVSGGLGYEAIAEALTIPVGTAKTRMRTALRELRSTLGPSLEPWHDRTERSER